MSFTEICSQWSNQDYASIGLDNSLAPNIIWFIICINAGLVYLHRYLSATIS